MTSQWEQGAWSRPGTEAVAEGLLTSSLQAGDRATGPGMDF